MEELSVCFRGPRGCGKRTVLLENLEAICKKRGLHWSIQNKLWTLETPRESDLPSGEDDDDGEITHAKGTVLPYESSPVHIGFDVARMSMQDKIYLQTILDKLGSGTEVLVGTNKKLCARILVLYHGQYLSQESVLLLHSAVEKSNGNLLLWITTEETPPFDLHDLFLVVPVSGHDRKLERFLKDHPKIPHGRDGQAWFDSVCRKWMNSHWNLDRIDEVREFVYACLLRNIRWQDMVSYWIDSLLKYAGEMGPARYRAALTAICNTEATGSGQTITAYRLPVAWECINMYVAKGLAPSIA
jgi:hypothetical protein